MTRPAAVILITCGLAVAAPVPKAVPKMEDVFGEISDPKGECKFQMGKGGVLTVTAPTSPKAFKLNGKFFHTPLVEKDVEGDFVATVRVGLSAPKDAKVTDQEKELVVMAGISVVPEGNARFGALCGHQQYSFGEGEGWSGRFFACRNRSPTSYGSGSWDLKLKPDTHLVIRLTRRGEDVLTEFKNGDKWQPWSKDTIEGMAERVKVGPTVACNIDKEFSATFDQYEIKPLPKDEKK